MAYTLTENEFFRTIDVTESSAKARMNAYFVMKDYIADKITESTFKTNYEKYLGDGGEINAHLLPDVSVALLKIINQYYPSKKTSITNACIQATSYFLNLKDDIGRSEFPKWEVKLLYTRFKASDGSYIDIPTGGTVTGKYTPTGQKITQ